MKISELAASLSESATMKFNERANQMRAEGKPIIHLGIGEPKNPTPINAILSSSAKLRVGDVKYSRVDGMPSLKKAVIEKIRKCLILLRNGLIKTVMF